ncbi:SSU ribosomal protein S16P [Syntrophobotulus glycolicus DSM 8271]|uniref:Small ribosomal subunit protein bS16 n=1 Tax=Syntrophobotulus glycolicus (strain DSM 8271 / FlGlyR) TaxID=645991 RepID=F0SUE3_SYNGF|nr:30S ribosomal protein S16 [Syntrophobotulus glycolicus]ADY56593.1 SSU ribosomal protein S16P [Syntrophobotulus glycolicus DSM 8271]
MATAIRLRRMGAKKNPFYRVVVCDSASRRDGRPIEEIGYYDPTKNPHDVKVDEIKAMKWLQEGAQPSDTVKSLFKKVGIMEKFHQSKK